jgi:hypothetical protein
VSESDRPIDRLLASLLAPGESGEAEAREVLGEDLPPEELDRVRRAVAAMARAAQPAEERAAILQTLRESLTGPRRLDRFVAAVARFFDIAEGDARALLQRIDTAEEWMEGPDVGITVMPVMAGERVNTALASLVRLPPGVTLGSHVHIGREQLLVLEGGFADSAGHVVWPGETLEMPAGSEHAMWGLPGPPCVCAALLWVDGGDGSAP